MLAFVRTLEEVTAADSEDEDGEEMGGKKDENTLQTVLDIFITTGQKNNSLTTDRILYKMWNIS